MYLLTKNAAEVERVAKLLHRACERHKKRVSKLTPIAWDRQYECIRASYRAMARAVVADRNGKEG